MQFEDSHRRADETLIGLIGPRCALNKYCEKLAE
jgi:hypothetical protein